MIVDMRTILLLALLPACAPTIYLGQSSDTGPSETTGPTSTTWIPGETDPNTTAPAFCSDTIREPWEGCDDGKFEGGYDGCLPGCVRGPHCGDLVIDVGHEVCDGGEGCPLDCGLSACEEISP